MTPFRSALLLSLIYLLLGVLWIAFSDATLMRLVDDTETLSELQTYKGWAYVFITSILLFGLTLSALRRERNLSQRDALTQLWNRHMFMRELTNQLLLAQHDNQSLCVVVINIDKFRELNTSAGQLAGDRLLRDVAALLREHFDSFSVIGRLTGDEFAIALRDADWLQDVIPAVSHLQEKVTQLKVVGKQQQTISCCAGIASFPADGESARELLNAAALALTEAKEAGRSQLRIYNREYGEGLQSRLQLTEDFKHALRHNELQLVYQPQFNLTDHHLVGVEVLLRWHHPCHGYISPDVFIPLAEQQNLIHAVTDFVIRTAIDELQESGLLYDKVSRLSINVSARDFFGENSHARFAEHFEQLSGAWSVLQLEITETAAMESIDVIRTVLERLKRKGVSVSLDDFGTGYSSLAVLRQLPISELKIDRSFINDLARDENDARLVRTILAMAESLSLRVVAEGVETEEQVQFLRRNGCQEVQGYHFAKPMPLAQLQKFIAQL